MISLDNNKIISLDKQLNYLNIKKEDGTLTRSLKLITKSFSFYTILAVILVFLFNAPAKVKLFVVILLLINALLGDIITRGRINRIKEVVGGGSDAKIIGYQTVFHLLLLMVIVFFFNVPKINKIDILYAIILFHIVIQIYMKFFDAEIVYMNFASKEMGLVIYTGLLLFSYGFIYFYKR